MKRSSKIQKALEAAGFVKHQWNVGNFVATAQGINFTYHPNHSGNKHEITNFGTSRNPYSTSSAPRFPKAQASMIIGKSIWGKSDSDPNTLAIHRVYDAPGYGPLFLENPACVLGQVIPQQTLNSIP